MKIRDLVKEWEAKAAGQRTVEPYAIRLPVQDAARLMALAEMYPLRSPEQLITELLGAALDELEQSLPYVRGERVIAEDEFDDPIHEDVGPTPRFQSLTQRYLETLRKEAGHGAS